MSVGLSSAILASVVCLTVSITILFRRPQRRLYGFFSAFTFALFLWHAAAFASHLSGTSIFHVQTSAGLLLPPTAILFFRELLRYWGQRINRLTVTASILVTVVLMALTFTPVGPTVFHQIMVLSYIAITLVLIGRAMVQQIKEARSTTDKKRLSYVFFGGLLAFVLGAGEMIPGTAIPAALGHVAVTFYVYFLYQSIIARRLIDMVELAGKAAVVGVLSIVLSAVYALLVLWVGADQQGLWLFNTLVASFVILILYDQVRHFVEQATARLIYRERYKLQEAVPELIRTLRTTIGLDDLRDRVLDVLEAHARTSQVALYMNADETEFSFVLLGSRGEQPPEMLTLRDQPTLLRELRAERRPILMEHLQNRLEGIPTFVSDDPNTQLEIERATETIDTLAELHATIVVPLLGHDSILGLLSLGVAPGAATYSTDEISALLQLAEACGIVLENSQEYEKERERDRLVAVGEMAAGLAHEIRNPLGAIKGAAQVLDPGELTGSAREFLDVIVEEVDRLNAVVEQFLKYARPYTGDPVPTDVNDVVAATLRLLGTEAIPDNVEIERDLGHDLPTVSIDPEQLKQVLINLVLNGIQAMPEGGTLNLRTRLAHQQSPDYTPEAPHPPHRAYVLVRVEDTGLGIAPEDLARVFVPFYTTKSNGTGLGLAISQRIIERAGGRLEVYSRRNHGTAFTIRLPAEPKPTAQEEGDEIATAPPGEPAESTLH